MKTQIETRVKMIAVLFALTATTASAQEPANSPIVAFSTVMQALEQRSDYGEFQAVRYDTSARAYDFRYTADDGTVKQLKIDAVTGHEISTVASDDPR
jgi:hypothetical protein